MTTDRIDDPSPAVPPPPPSAPLLPWLPPADPSPAAPTPTGSSGEPPPAPTGIAVDNPLAPLAALRATLQPIAADLLNDRAYWELLKRNASPRTFLEFVRFAFAADLEGRAGQGNNQQVIIQAPFPRGPLDVLPPHMKID